MWDPKASEKSNLDPKKIISEPQHCAQDSTDSEVDNMSSSGTRNLEIHGGHEGIRTA
jgi:hypothetical protein